MPAFVSSPFDVVVKQIPTTYYDLDLSTDQTDYADADYLEWDKEYVYVLADKYNSSTAANNYYPGTDGQSYTSTRFYKNSSLTISYCDGYVLDIIDFSATTENYAKALADSEWTNASASVSGTKVRVLVEDGTADIDCLIGANCGFTKIRFYYNKTWARNFLDTFTCTGVVAGHENGAISVANPTTVWATLGESISDELKETLKTLPANENGNVNEQAMARYDLVIRKYGKATYTDFIGRFSDGGVNASAKLFGIVNDDNNSPITMIIVLISVLSVASVGGYFFLRKRKENN